MNKIRKSIILILMFAILSGIAYAEIPPDPVNLSTVVNGGWINYTWAAGTGNVTNTYNVSISVSGAARTWTNGSSNTTSNNSVGIDQWAEIWVWAYNSSADNESLSTGYLYADTQAERSMFGEVIDLMNAVPDILNPVVDIIIIIIKIMIILAIGILVAGIMGAIAIGLQKKLKMK